MHKRILAALLAVSLVLPGNLTVFADENETNESSDIETGKLGTGYIPPEDDEALSIHRADEPALYSASPESQQSYYKTENLPEVRNQNSYGTCWAFATIGCMEINLMKKGYTDIDLSELHLAYFAYHSVVDPLGGFEGDYYTYTETNPTFLDRGGNYLYSSNVLMDWLGAASESTVPYSMAEDVLKNGLPDEVAYQDVAHLENMWNISTADVMDVKQAIVDYGAVQISYYTLANWGSDLYYNAATGAQYCYDEKTENHAIVVVGWDDNYSASNFVTAPPGDGAWIVRNSWGDSWGKDGYFYLSYYDKSLSSEAIVYEAGLSDNYDNNYQYDGAFGRSAICYGSATAAANVFQAKANASGAEQVEAVSFQTSSVNCEYAVSIYKNLTDLENPESGELCTTVTGTTTYKGIYTIPLDEPVYVDEGVYYSVVIDLMAIEDDGTSYIVLDYGKSNDNQSSAGEHQSYLYNGSSWMDYGKSENTNFRIKAYTGNITKESTIPATSILLDKSSLVMKKGDKAQLTATVQPENASNKAVIWTSSNESIATVSSSGLVRALTVGDATITAKSAADGSVMATCLVSVKQPMTSISLGLTSFQIQMEESYQLQVSYYPANTTDDKTVTWTSADTKIATVDQNGLVSAVSPGTTTITARVGNFTAEATVVVKPILISQIGISGWRNPLVVGDTIRLTATVYPSNAANKNVKWSSDNESVATVDASGVVRAVGVGTATIKAASCDGSGAYSTGTVTVEAPSQPDTPSTPDTPSAPDDSNSTDSSLNGMVTGTDGKRYWYENGVKQGLEGRGKEIYDPESGAWYWLDSVQDGAVAVSKDVYQESDAGAWADNEDGTGKWVRYDENGHMIKGWSTNENGTYYFDPIYGTMAKGDVVIDGRPCYFDPATGVAADNQWITIDGNEYWYENGVRQGLDGRGKEIYDPDTDAWYWLDSVDMGKKAVSKDVYQESYSAYPDREDGTGKWVRYDASGHMVKGWQATEQGTYYFEEITGAMAKGNVLINGTNYYFDEATGILR